MASTRIKKETGLTTKELNFALHYAAHGNAYVAYLHSYNVKHTNSSSGRWMYNKAYQILLKPKVQEKIREIHRMSTSSAIVDHDRLVLMYLESYDMAKMNGNDIGMTSATTMLAKFCGLMTERTENVNINVDESMDALVRRIRERQARLGLPQLRLVGESSA